MDKRSLWVEYLAYYYSAYEIKVGQRHGSTGATITKSTIGFTIVGTGSARRIPALAPAWCEFHAHDPAHSPNSNYLRTGHFHHGPGPQDRLSRRQKIHLRRQSLSRALGAI